MRENSPLARIAFWAVTALAILWVVSGAAMAMLGVIAEPLTFWPLLIIFGPIGLVALVVILDRARNSEDDHYSRNVHD